MEESPLKARLLRCLIDARVVFQSGHSAEDIALLLELFAEDLAGEKPEEVAAAFALHRKRSSRFPTPAQIIALLPECRDITARPALPEKPVGRRVKGMGKLAMLALRGNAEARAIMESREHVAQEKLEKIIGDLCAKVEFSTRHWPRSGEHV